MQDAWLVVERVTRSRYVGAAAADRFLEWWREADLCLLTGPDAAEEICLAALRAIRSQDPPATSP